MIAEQNTAVIHHVWMETTMTDPNVNKMAMKTNVIHDSLDIPDILLGLVPQDLLL